MAYYSSSQSFYRPPKYSPRKHKKHTTSVLLVILATIVTAGFFAYSALIKEPSNFPDNEILTVKKGESLSEVASALEDKNVVNSQFALRNAIIFLGGENSVVAGDYFFDKPVDVFTVARRVSSGDFNLKRVRITIPEGFDNFEIAYRLKDQLPGFDAQRFLYLAKEGYMFPDTYFFSPTIHPDRVAEVMQNNFQEKLGTIKEGVNSFGMSIDQIVTMASILERETNTPRARRVVAGILWKRIEEGVPLQVDATFSQINGKSSAQLTREDLKTDSPYNTYRYPGLPPGPIANPGLDSLKAAVNPITTEYFYFLTGDDGNMYYARTLKEHKKNKRTYLE